MLKYLAAPRYFNSQPHKEADHYVKNVFGQDEISTHSLTRRLTSANYVWGAYLYISTHSLTRRLTALGKSFDNFLFISTHSLTRRLTA